MPDGVTSYYIALHTGTDYSVDEYHAAAGRLMQLLVSLMSDKETLHSLTTPVPTHTKCEIEVLLEPTASGRELVCRAVLDLHCEKAKFDKARFSKLVRAHESALEWPDLKIAKRTV
tara:strand:+ start:314 stop:661 length:348 start_codon:yes stop_codon:yes gene_type:complete